MKVNKSNIEFRGNLYLKKPDYWTEDMQRAVRENESIQRTLEKNDVIGVISTKKERHVPSYYARHRQGDTLYKVKFIVKDEEQSLSDKIKNIFKISKKYVLSRHYRSEDTTVERIEDMDIDGQPFFHI